MSFLCAKHIFNKKITYLVVDLSDIKTRFKFSTDYKN